MKPLKEDNCEVMKALYAVYSVPQAAALWCGIKEDNIDEILVNAEAISGTGVGRGIFRHPYIECLEPRTRAITEAIESCELLHGREDGSPVNAGDHVAYERRHVLGRYLKEWMEKALPNEKPAFLFDDIERSSHASISQDAYRTLKAEHDKLEKRLENAKGEYKKLREAKESIESERNSLRSIVESLNSQLESHSSQTDATLVIIQSEYWERLTNMASKAVDGFPAWKKTQRQVQKTGNLMDWLTNSLGADNREAEILKKVLSDFFNELR